MLYMKAFEWHHGQSFDICIVYIKSINKLFLVFTLSMYLATGKVLRTRLKGRNKEIRKVNKTF